jgi:hypothetical protein
MAMSVLRSEDKNCLFDIGDAWTERGTKPVPCVGSRTLVPELLFSIYHLVLKKKSEIKNPIPSNPIQSHQKKTKQVKFSKTYEGRFRQNLPGGRLIAGWTEPAGRCRSLGLIQLRKNQKTYSEIIRRIKSKKRLKGTGYFRANLKRSRIFLSILLFQIQFSATIHIWIIFCVTVFSSIKI